MKKKVLRLLPITVAPDVHPEGKQTPPPAWNTVAAFGICWRAVLVPGVHSFHYKSITCVWCLRLFSLSPSWYIRPVSVRCHLALSHFILENNLVFTCCLLLGQRVHPGICLKQQVVSPAKYPLSQKTTRTFHMVLGGDCSRDFRRPPRQFVELLHSLLDQISAKLGMRKKTCFPFPSGTVFCLLSPSLYIYIHTHILYLYLSVKHCIHLLKNS